MNREDTTLEPNKLVDFYWRDGCWFCATLIRELTDAGVMINKMNIWDNPDHAAFVRSVANGNETVPTVVIDSVVLVNPSAQDVLKAMAD
jgi:glutaredoxin